MRGSIGNHLKMHLPHSLRQQAEQFYTEVLGCPKLKEMLYPNLDLYEFQGGFVLGLFPRREGPKKWTQD